MDDCNTRLTTHGSEPWTRCGWNIPGLVAGQAIHQVGQYYETEGAGGIKTDREAGLVSKRNGRAPPPSVGHYQDA